jgi:hypothetical protein
VSVSWNYTFKETVQGLSLTTYTSKQPEEAFGNLLRFTCHVVLDSVFYLVIADSAILTDVTSRAQATTTCSALFPRIFSKRDTNPGPDCELEARRTAALGQEYSSNFPGNEVAGWRGRTAWYILFLSCRRNIRIDKSWVGGGGGGVGGLGCFLSLPKISLAAWLDQLMMADCSTWFHASVIRRLIVIIAGDWKRKSTNLPEDN